jgi:hypothetical protein
MEKEPKELGLFGKIQVPCYKVGELLVGLLNL